MSDTTQDVDNTEDEGFTTFDKWFTVTLIVLTILGMLAIAIWDSVRDQRAEDEKYRTDFFAGACWGVGGQVVAEGLCAKGDTIVLKKSDVFPN